MNQSSSVIGIDVPPIVASPHAHGGASVGRIMRRVMLALAPATAFAFWMYGWPAIDLFLITVGSCAFFELLCQRLRGLPSTVGDGSALLTGWLLALTLPPWAPWWIGVVGAFIAIVIGKAVFGGLGQNLFNPAMVARVALLISFPVVMTQWVVPQPITGASAPGFVEGLQTTFGAANIPDGVTSASLLGHVKSEASRGVGAAQALTGEHAPGAPWHGLRVGSLGESAALLLLAGGLYLIACGVIRWHVPAAVLAGLALPALAAHALAPDRYLAAHVHLLSGAAVLGAFFIATDYVTSPNTVAGQWIFGLAIGALTWIIRTWGGYPEGMAFAVLLMNALTPVIDRFCQPRVLGRLRNGKALEPTINPPREAR